MLESSTPCSLSCIPPTDPALRMKTQTHCRPTRAPHSRSALLWAPCPAPFSAAEIKSTCLLLSLHLKQHGIALTSSLSHILALFHFPKSKLYPTLGSRAAKAQGGLPDPIDLLPFLKFLTLWFWFYEYDCCPTLDLPAGKCRPVAHHMHLPPPCAPSR